MYKYIDLFIYTHIYAGGLLWDGPLCELGCSLPRRRGAAERARGDAAGIRPLGARDRRRLGQDAAVVCVCDSHVD